MSQRRQHPAIEKIILLMVSGMSTDDIAAAAPKIGVAPEQIDLFMRRARRVLARAAAFNRDEELGSARVRLRDIYARAIRSQDPRTALAAQRELNRLLGLAPSGDDEAQPNADTGPDRRDAELHAIATHLIPLNLAPPDYPLREHARIAADRIREITTPAAPAAGDSPTIQAGRTTEA